MTNVVDMLCRGLMNGTSGHTWRKRRKQKPCAGIFSGARPRYAAKNKAPLLFPATFYDTWTWPLKGRWGLPRTHLASRAEKL